MVRKIFYGGIAHGKTAKITTLCNQKGGAGKTVTAVNLGIGLAREGKRVLLVEVDPQGSLTASLNGIRDRYDVILLDCCPSLGMLTINALAAADEVIIPAQAHYLSLRGMEQLIRTIFNVKRKINPNLEIAGIHITLDTTHYLVVHPNNK